jgi:hypothetical protein
MPQADRLQIVVILLARFIPFWLATVTPSQIDVALCPKLVRYQRELVNVLNRLYGHELTLARPSSAGSLSAELYRRLDELFVELRLTCELLLEQRSSESRQNAQLEVLETAVDDLQIVQHTAIDSAQQEVLKRGSKRMAVRYRQRTGSERHALLFAQFCKTLGTRHYDELLARLYTRALRWIEAQAKTLLPDHCEVLPSRHGLLL